MSKLGEYIKKHGRAFRVQRKNGKGAMEVLFYDGYVTIRTVQPGVPKFINEIHITRSAWHTLYHSEKTATATKLMQGPDFDRYAAERTYYAEEAILLDELRQQKRHRQGPRRRRRT